MKRLKIRIFYRMFRSLTEHVSYIRDMGCNDDSLITRYHVVLIICTNDVKIRSTYVQTSVSI